MSGVSMFRKITSLTLLCALLISLFGCATVLKTKQTSLPVDSQPQGAEVFLVTDNYARRVGITPTVIMLDNRRTSEVSFRKYGYQERRYTAKPHINDGWMTASFLCLSVPALVDLLTQSAMSFKETEIRVTLEPILPE